MSRRSLALVAGCGCMAIGLAWVALILPAQRRASSSDAEAARLRDRLAMTAQAPSEPQQTAGISPKLQAALHRAIPGQPMGGAVIGTLARAAASTGLDLSAVNLGAPGAPATNGKARAIPVRFDVRGSYKEMVSFLDRLETLVSHRGQRIRADGRLISIDAVSIDAGHAGTGKVLVARMRGSAYTMPAGGSGP